MPTFQIRSFRNLSIDRSSKKRLINLVGPPQSGKSTLLSMLRVSLGDRYGGTSDLSKTFTQKVELDGGKVKLADFERQPLVGPNSIEFGKGGLSTLQSSLIQLLTDLPDQDKKLLKSSDWPLKNARAKRTQLNQMVEYLAGQPVPAALQAEIAANGKQIEKLEEEDRRKKELVNQFWPSVRDRLLENGFLKLDPAPDIAKWETMVIQLADAHAEDGADLPWFDCSESRKMATKLALFCKTADLLKRPSVLLLDDDEIKAWRGKYLAHNLKTLAIWTKKRSKQGLSSFLVVASQERLEYCDFLDEIYLGAARDQ